MARPLCTDDVTSYPTATGWTVSGSWRAAQVWSRDDYDVLVLPDDAVAYTEIRLRELVACVAVADAALPVTQHDDFARSASLHLFEFSVDDGDRWRIGGRGTLAIDGVAEDRQRQVPVRLAGAEQYAAAVNVHRDGHWVGVHGPISRIARSTGIVAAADGFTEHHP